MGAVASTNQDVTVSVKGYCIEIQDQNKVSKCDMTVCLQIGLSVRDSSKQASHFRENITRSKESKPFLEEYHEQLSMLGI